MNNLFKYTKYPNPLFRRENFIILDGMWDFEITNSEEIPFYTKNIIVPFSYETKASGINDQTQYDTIWYRRKVKLNKNKKYNLCFLGVDYNCYVFVNKRIVGVHEGAYTAFKIDITDYIVEGNNIIDIKVNDSYRKDQLRGKQRTRNENYDCWYEQTTGIYKTVYIEEIGSNPIDEIMITGDKNGKVNYDIRINRFTPLKLEIIDNEKVIHTHFVNEYGELKGSFELNNFKLWDIDNPYLYEVKVTSNGEVDDVVGTYFGFRTIETKNKKIYLNDKELYQRLILNQGYYKDSGLSIPSYEYLLDEIKLIKDMGFNGFRMHQKIEDFHCYYFADVLGLVVWAEVPSMYEFTENGKYQFNRDLQIIARQLYNCPSIITYVLFNESWGVPNIKENKNQQEFIEEQYHKIKDFDSSRLVIANDGWHQLSCTDILSLHEYQQDSNKFYEDYKDKEYLLNELIVNTFGPCFANGHSYNNQPIILSEFGGVSFIKDGWGYGDKAKSVEEYHERIVKLFKVIENLPYVEGYCYTQLSDVRQETNGLVDEERNLRLSIDKIKEFVEV